MKLSAISIIPSHKRPFRFSIRQQAPQGLLHGRGSRPSPEKPKRLLHFKVDKAGVLHSPLGKVSFGPEKICDNLKALLETVIRLKPSASKGQYMVSMAVSTTMGPGFKVDMTQVKKFIEG